MVNASLNWASIVGIVLAVGGALLYFMRSFKPALARDYDVFFAAVGLLCGGILFFQGWRLDPILQFGQFLLAGTTVFFAYESVRLRGITTEQARRSTYFDDEEPAPAPPYRPRMGGARAYDDDIDRFDEPEPIRRRIPERDGGEEDLYRPRRSSRVAIPERAASRRPVSEDWGAARPDPGDRPTPTADSRESGPFSRPARYATNRPSAATSTDFGSRRRDRDSGSEPRRGSRPVPAADSMPRSSRRPSSGPTSPATPAPGVPQGSPIRGAVARGQASAATESQVSDADYAPVDPSSRPGTSPASPPSSMRDNSSRFDD